MEISEVLKALECLKEELENIKSAREQVEKAVVAAKDVSAGFNVCGNRLKAVGEKMQSLMEAIVASQAQFDKDIIEPMRNQVLEIKSMSDNLKGEVRTIIDGFSNGCDACLKEFQSTLRTANQDLSDRIGEFHKELDSFGSMITRMTQRVEEKISSLEETIDKKYGELLGGIDVLQRRVSDMGTLVSKGEKKITSQVGELAMTMSGRLNDMYIMVQSVGQNLSNEIAGKFKETNQSLALIKKMAIFSFVALLIVLGAVGWLSFRG